MVVFNGVSTLYGEYYAVALFVSKMQSYTIGSNMRYCAACDLSVYGCVTLCVATVYEYSVSCSEIREKIVAVFWYSECNIADAFLFVVELFYFEPDEYVAVTLFALYCGTPYVGETTAPLSCIIPFLGGHRGTGTDAALSQLLWCVRRSSSPGSAAGGLLPAEYR